MVLPRFKVLACAVIQLFAAVGTAHNAGNIFVLPVLVGRRLFLRNSCTRAHVSASMIASWVFSNTSHFPLDCNRFFVLVGLLIGFEVYRMPLIFWTLQNISYGIARPVIGLVRRRVPRCPACLLKMDCRRYDFILFQNTSNLRRSVTVQTKGEYPLDYFGGFSVHNPMFSVIRVFHVTIWRICAEMFARFSF